MNKSGKKTVKEYEEKNKLYKELSVLQHLINYSGIPIEYIANRTGLSRYNLGKILFMPDYDTTDIKDNYDKYREMTYCLTRFYNREKYNFNITLNYHKLPANEFGTVFNRLYNELNLHDKIALSKEAKLRLQKWYDSLKEAPKVINSDGTPEPLPLNQALDIFIYDNTPSEKHEEMITALSQLNDINRRIELLESDIYDDELALKIGTYYCEEDENEVYFEDYFELSDEEKERTIKRVKENKEELKRLKDILESIKGREEVTDLEKQYSIFILSEYDMSSRIEKNLSGLHDHNLTDSKFHKLTTDQQKAVLNVMLDKCFDNNGYLIPDHFGSAMYLMKLNVGYSLRSFDWVNIKDNYSLGYTLPIIPDSDPIREFIDHHSRVLLKCPFKDQIHSVRQTLSGVTSDISDRIFLILKNRSYLEKLGSENHREYYKTLSEYLDLVSETEPIGKARTYSREQLYRLVYEKCQSSDGEYSFSSDLVKDLQRKLPYTPKDWLWEMYIFSYCTRYKSTKRLISYIRKLESKKIEHEEERADI